LGIRKTFYTLCVIDAAAKTTFAVKRAKKNGKVETTLSAVRIDTSCIWSIVARLLLLAKLLSIRIYPLQAKDKAKKQI